MGDVQGCAQAFERLLDEIAFSPSRDQLVLLGDLVNRGPDSATVLRRVQGLGPRRAACWATTTCTCSAWFFFFFLRRAAAGPA